jgi:hypothetical protein
MKANIKYTLKILYTQFLLFLLMPILLAITYETDILPIGLYAGDAHMQYIFETIGILVTIICVPLTLKLSHIVRKRKKEKVVLPVALKHYLYLYGGRLSLLEIAVLLNVNISYITLDNFSGFCVLMALVASLYYLPGKKLLCKELKLR